MLAQANILASRQVALALFNEVGVQNLAAFDSYAADPYYSHSTHVAANGTAAMKELIAGTFALNPEFSVDVKRVVAEGDLVAVHFHARMNTDPGLAFVDIYRVRDGKVVEFWDVMQEVSTTFVSGYEMF